MAKRLQLNFRKAVPSRVEEDGQPRPCAMGTGWVNPDTLATLAKCDIPRTDPWGRPLSDAVPE
ncbi:MAG: hypothetical protein ACE5E4_07470 [Candidatus Binatia bacterium]